MTWIATVAYPEATGHLKTLYDRVKGPDDNVDNIMMAHSLRPHTMDGHMAASSTSRSTMRPRRRRRPATACRRRSASC